jgi:hypothetical protein
MTTSTIVCTGWQQDLIHQMNTSGYVFRELVYNEVTIATKNCSKSSKILISIVVAMLKLCSLCYSHRCHTVIMEYDVECEYRQGQPQYKGQITHNAMD